MTASNAEPIIELQNGQHRVTILGTAHVSKTSAEKVRELIENGDYDCVAIELCESRHRTLIDPDAIAKMDLFQVIRQGKASMVAANLALGAFQQRMAEELDIKPGAEMRMAIDLAIERQLKLELIDRDIAVTLKRVYHNVPWWQRMNIVAGLLASVVTRQKVSEEEIEKLKEGDMLESVFSQFAEEAESIYRPLVDERDQFMAAHIQQLTRNTRYKHMLAVVGAGHLAGIKAYLMQTNEWQLIADVSHAVENTINSTANVEGKLAASNKPAYKVERDQEVGRMLSSHPESLISRLMVLPKPSQWIRFIPWLIVALVFVGFALGFNRNSDLGWQLVVEWIVLNGGLAAIGAVIALGHPLTVIVAFIAAPITSLNPTIGAGMVTGAVELYLRKPTVSDFSALRTDTARWQGWWQNRVTRVLLVFIFSTLGSAAGTYLAGYRIFQQLT